MSGRGGDPLAAGQHRQLRDPDIHPDGCRWPAGALLGPLHLAGERHKPAALLADRGRQDPRGSLLQPTGQLPCRLVGLEPPEAGQGYMVTVGLHPDRAGREPARLPEPGPCAGRGKPTWAPAQRPCLESTQLRSPLSPARPGPSRTLPWSSPPTRAPPRPWPGSIRAAAPATSTAPRHSGRQHARPAAAEPAPSPSCRRTGHRRYSTPNRASRSRCSTTIVVACGSASSRRSFAHLPFSPARPRRPPRRSPSFLGGPSGHPAISQCGCRCWSWDDTRRRSPCHRAGYREAPRDSSLMGSGGRRPAAFQPSTTARRSCRRSLGRQPIPTASSEDSSTYIRLHLRISLL